jgi:hypothetical protein
MDVRSTYLEIQMTFKISLAEQLRQIRTQDHSAAQLRIMSEIRDEKLKEFKRAHHMDVVNKNKVDVYV